MPAHPEQEAHLFLGNLLDLASMIADIQSDEKTSAESRLDNRRREVERFKRLGGSYDGHLFAFAEVDHEKDLTLNVKDIIEKLETRDLEFLKLYFELFAEIIVDVVRLSDEEEAAPPSADAIATHYERTMVAKRMWEFREALKALLLEKRAANTEEMTRKANEQKKMLEEKTAELHTAHEAFRKFKNETRDALREAVMVADKQTDATKELTKELEGKMDQRLGEHDKHLQAIEYGTTSVDLLIEAQRTMLSYRVCGMCLLDRRMLRRICYVCIGFIFLIMTAYGMSTVF